MEREIYLDHSATAPMLPAARAAMCEAMENYGNPSSLHAAGVRAAETLRAARETVGAALGVRHLREGEVIFTGSGTEASAVALLGTARAKARRGANVILTTDSEHPSVAKNLDILAAEGYRVVRVPTRGGVLDMQTVRAACGPELFAVSMMLVNNETGARYPVEEVFAAAKAANPACICHCDAVQAFLKVPFTAAGLGADLVTISAHKIGGPKGVGALYVSPALMTAHRIVPLYAGGGQENGMRSGTENLLGIVGFAAAIAERQKTFTADAAHMAKLAARLIAGLAGSEITVNRPPVAAPHIVSITLPHIKSETALRFLSGRGIYVSAGSACSAKDPHPSDTLLAFGLSPAAADCTLRVSFGAENTAADVDALLTALGDAARTLVRIRR